MSRSVPFIPALGAAPLAAGLGATIRRLGSAIAREWAVRRDLREIQSLDGRMLADIGVSRSAVESAVRNGRRGHSYRADTGRTEGALMPASFTEWR